MARRTIGAAALGGTVMLLTTVATAPAHAVLSPNPPTPDPLATATLALCVGEQPGASNYLYAEGPSYVPSTNTQMTVPSVGPGIDCMAYPVEPGQYWVATYKYPKAPCTQDETRGKNTQPCYAKVHHIHVSHERGVLAGATPGTGGLLTPVLTQDGTAGNPNCPVDGTASNAAFAGPPTAAATPTVPGQPYGCAQTPITVIPGRTDTSGNPEYGLEYNNPTWSDDTVIEQQTVLVTVHAGELVQVAAHTTDHRTVDCWTGFDPDPNGNAPVCN